MKSWLITTMGPFYGTQHYYAAYSETDPLNIDEVNNWFYNEETLNLWDAYGYSWEQNIDEDDWIEDYDTYDDYLDDLIRDWQDQCSIDSRECSEEDLDDYVPGGVGHLDIIYDEREK